ncbi:dihydroorotate dehydrogenase [Treponema zioleckii]|uniref:dihydroorotate dehydrogenase n=1 Tax=Treponema zioleckii TaxID=331680 RepID=UPI00168AC67B|nr:dihydroorotate dehydrogenase [Treponema zioleckii]
MEEIKNCEGIPLPVFTTGIVTYSYEADGAVPYGSVWHLKISVSNINGKMAQLPLPGQFYLLRSVKSGTLLGRPISVYASVEGSVTDPVRVEFLILRKGSGTEELAHLKNGDEIQLLGPLGNCFVPPDENAKVAIVGGGIGVAPVAGFASTLKEKSYDFYAAFKSGSYGLKHVKPNKLVVTTDDGSVGIKGMITAAIDEHSVKKYDVVYACGPMPMLAYIQKICLAAGVKCWLSMEKRMACGLGACLGCTIKTSEGNKRCCKDGPVFDGKILDFTPPSVMPIRNAGLADEPDLSVDIKGVHFENPVIAASGTFGYGSEYSTVFNVNELGGICSKGLTLEVKPGNGGVRLVETPSGLINSIGLENPGIEHFIRHELPSMMALSPVAIANLSGSSLDGYVKGAELLDKTEVPLIELNISCPNVKAGGMAFGMQAEAASTVVSAVREATKKPLMVKLSPNAPDLIGVAMAVREAGADALSLVNTFQATSIDIETGRPIFDNIRAGFSGPAVKPIALRMVYDVVQAMNKLPPCDRIPVVGLGGISCWQDAVEFIMAGAAAIEVGTATFSNPFAMTEIIDGLRKYMIRKGFKSLNDFRGCAQ